MRRRLRGRLCPRPSGNWASDQKVQYSVSFYNFNVRGLLNVIIKTAGDPLSAIGMNLCLYLVPECQI
jgi:hypothetical protein